ncbi:3835_t:CDS:2, partial [Scutellospora calospora]
MSSTHITPSELIKTDIIVSELYYGLYLRDYLLQFRYICEGSRQSSGIVTSASTAITSVYQSIFSTKTKFLELAYLGLDQNKTVQKLLKNVTFRFFIIKLENISIFVSSLVVNEYRDTSPNTVWQQTGVLKSICGKTLFAINHPTTLYNLEQIYKTQFHYQISIPNNCTVEFWTNVPNPEKDHNTLKSLYEDGFLNILSPTSSDKIAHAIKRYVKIGYNLTEGANIEIALQNLSGTSVAHIEPNCNLTTETLVLADQNNINPNSELLRPSPTFSEPSIPKTIWTTPTSKKSELLTNETDEEIGWALKEIIKLGNKGIGKHMTKKVLQYLQSFFLADNLKAADRYSPEDMHADFEDLAKNGELTFEKILSVKTIK